MLDNSDLKHQNQVMARERDELMRLEIAARIMAGIESNIGANHWERGKSAKVALLRADELIEAWKANPRPFVKEDENSISTRP